MWHVAVQHDPGSGWPGQRLEPRIAQVRRQLRRAPLREIVKLDRDAQAMQRSRQLANVMIVAGRASERTTYAKRFDHITYLVDPLAVRIATISVQFRNSTVILAARSR